MTSKERVRNTIHFKGIDHIPVNFNIEGALSDNVPVYDDDIVWTNLDRNPDFVPSVSNATHYENEWGVIFKRINTAIGEPEISPLADIENLSTYKIPDLGADYRFESAKRIVKENPDKYVLGCLSACDTGAMLFMLLLDLFGFEECMIDLALYQEEVEDLISRITDQHIRSIEGFAKAGVDGIIAGDDLGLQERMIISPEMWRKLFKPYYAKIIKAAHDNHMEMMLHICGYIDKIIDDLIEIGLDVLQIDQQDHMGIEHLGQKYGGRIAFFCPTDIQTTLCQDDAESVKNKAIQLITNLSSEKGGFIAKMYPQPDSIGICQENIDIMCRTFIDYGNYKK